MQVSVAGRYFTVTDLESAAVRFRAGQLPLKWAGYDVGTTTDLRGGDRSSPSTTKTPRRSSLLDTATRFDELNLSNLRTSSAAESSGGYWRDQGSAFFSARIAPRLLRCIRVPSKRGVRRLISIINYKQRERQGYWRAPPQSLRVVPWFAAGQ